MALNLLLATGLEAGGCAAIAGFCRQHAAPRLSAAQQFSARVAIVVASVSQQLVRIPPALLAAFVEPAYALAGAAPAPPCANGCGRVSCRHNALCGACIHLLVAVGGILAPAMIGYGPSTFEDIIVGALYHRLIDLGLTHFEVFRQFGTNRTDIIVRRALVVDGVWKGFIWIVIDALSGSEKMVSHGALVTAAALANLYPAPSRVHVIAMNGKEFTPLGGVLRPTAYGNTPAQRLAMVIRIDALIYNYVAVLLTQGDRPSDPVTQLYAYTPFPSVQPLAGHTWQFPVICAFTDGCCFVDEFLPLNAAGDRVSSAFNPASPVFPQVWYWTSIVHGIHAVRRSPLLAPAAVAPAGVAVAAADYFPEPTLSAAVADNVSATPGFIKGAAPVAGTLFNGRGTHPGLVESRLAPIPLTPAPGAGAAHPELAFYPTVLMTAVAAAASALGVYNEADGPATVRTPYALPVGAPPTLPAVINAPPHPLELAELISILPGPRTVAYGGANLGEGL